MATRVGPLRVFLSHASSDKVIARRVLRRMVASGVEAWIDEANLRLGSRLPESIERNIAAADVVVVIASERAEGSAWVARELAHARRLEKPVVPFFVEPVSAVSGFRDDLGVDASDPYQFGASLEELLRSLCAAAGAEALPPDPVTLRTGIDALAREEPRIGPLLLALSSGEGWPGSLGEANLPFHPLDHALWALLESEKTELIAAHAASAFPPTGLLALKRWIELSGDGGLPMVTAVGKELPPAAFGAALRLLRACSPPNNHALYSFISRNAAHFDTMQTAETINLVVWPRRGPERLGDVLGSVALEHFPAAQEIQTMWRWWIADGRFDGEPCTPSLLAANIAVAHKQQIAGWEPVYEALRSHVRGCLRSGDKRLVAVAVLHIIANANERTPALALLIRETHGVSGSAEWDEWRERAPDDAEEMTWYLSAFVQEASGSQNWQRALGEFERLVAFEKWRRAALAQLDA